MKSDYRQLGTGDATTATDPKRGVWYSAAASCGYWTDDWSKLSTRGKHGIPCCPQCGCVGMETDADDWLGGAKKHEENGNHGYLEFCLFVKEKCGRAIGKTWQERYAAFKRLNEQFPKKENGDA